MMYIANKDIQDLYILHRYSVGGAQGEESFLEEVITSSNDVEELRKIGEERFSEGNKSGWRWDDYMIVVNTNTEAGRAMYNAQKAEWKQQWKEVDEHPERYKGAVVCGDRENGGPIAMRLTPFPELDTPIDWGKQPKSTYTYMLFDITDKETTDGQQNSTE